MSCEVAALPFQAGACYGTWSIDFEYFLLSISITWHIGMNKAILLTINKVLSRLNKGIKWVVMFNNIFII